MLSTRTLWFVSPCDRADIDAICRTSRTGLVAECAGCGGPIYRDAHMPLVAHGFFHAACCPCSQVVLTEDEQRALEANRARERDAAPAPLPGQRGMKRRWDQAGPDEREAMRERMREIGRLGHAKLLARRAEADPAEREAMRERLREWGRMGRAKRWAGRSVIAKVARHTLSDGKGKPLDAWPENGVIRRLVPDHQFKNSEVRERVWGFVRDGRALDEVLEDVALIPKGRYIVRSMLSNWGLATVVERCRA